MKSAGRLFLLLLLLFVPQMAGAHEVRPAYLELAETRPGQWDVTWKQPIAGDRAIRLEPQLSNGWLERPPVGESLAADHLLRLWRISAPVGQLAGSTVRVAGLERTITDVLVHVRTADGRTLDAILRRDNPSATIAFGVWSGIPARAYLALGIRHIVGGIDHLLFVFGLLLLVGRGWRLLGVITAFTLAHSLTLAASALGLVRAPVAVVEALVAWSIVFVAYELTRGAGRERTLGVRHPWIVALAFGLLHGFAFAGALADTGLPPDAIPLALLLFNLGVEIGQLLFVGAVLALLWGWRRLAMQGSARLEPVFARTLAPYAMGCYASFLFFERAVAAFA